MNRECRELECCALRLVARALEMSAVEHHDGLTVSVDRRRMKDLCRILGITKRMSATQKNKAYEVELYEYVDHLYGITVQAAEEVRTFMEEQS